MFENASMCLRCGNLINILTNCDFVFDDITYKRLIKFFDCTVGKVGATQKAAKLYRELLCFCLKIYFVYYFAKVRITGGGGGVLIFLYTFMCLRRGNLSNIN